MAAVLNATLPGTFRVPKGEGEDARRVALAFMFAVAVTRGWTGGCGCEEDDEAEEGPCGWRVSDWGWGLDLR